MDAIGHDYAMLRLLAETPTDHQQQELDIFASPLHQASTK
jgi:hypothetical protein